MKYLVDGHNLIPKLGGRLDAPDDEMRLVQALQDFCRAARAQVDVFFDGAPPGQAGTRRFGSVSAHFVRQGLTADEAIMRRVQQLGKTAANHSVVSSDRRVQVAAREAHARVLSSEQFAGLVRQAGQAGPDQPGGGSAALSEAEVDEWLRLFGENKTKNS